jgi:hypothetical protein
LAATTTVATAMAGGTDNNQLKSAAKTRWRWRQQFVDDDEDDNDDDDDKHDEHDDDNDEDDEQDDKDDKHDKYDDDKHNEDNDDVDDDDDNDDNEANTATAVGGDDDGGNSDGWGHRQQSNKISSKDTVAVATAIC